MIRRLFRLNSLFNVADSNARNYNMLLQPNKKSKHFAAEIWGPQIRYIQIDIVTRHSLRDNTQ